MAEENIVYVKTENGIFKCYKSESMHQPIYYTVGSKMNGYIDYNEVEKILTIEDLYQENQELNKENDRLAAKLNKNKILQNEFRKWLENESKELIRDAGYHQRICLDILEKYKEIIGDKKCNI